MPKADIAKLFLHKILVDVPSEDLLKMFAEYNIVEVQVCCFAPLMGVHNVSPLFSQNFEVWIVL